MSQYALRLPNSLLEQAKKVASQEETSVNQLFVMAIAEKISALGTEELLMKHTKIADKKAYFELLSKVASKPPQKDDEIE